MKFIICGGGDSSVGIWASDEVVTFEGNSVWDEDLIKQTKEMLREWDDNGADIYTEEEYNEDTKCEVSE